MKLNNDHPMDDATDVDYDANDEYDAAMHDADDFTRKWKSQRIGGHTVKKDWCLCWS
jgi:hypothetical protein